MQRAEGASDDEVMELRRRRELLLATGVSVEGAWRMIANFFSPAAARVVFPELRIPERTTLRTAPRPAPTPSVAALSSKPLPSRIPPVTPAEGTLGLELSFQYAPLIQCTFPHSCPDPATSFTRRNGRLSLTIATKRPEIGLPYGVPARLLTIYITSEAVRARSREVPLCATLHEFLRAIDVPISRGPRGSLTIYANQLMRLIETAFTIEEDLQDSKGRVGLDIRQTLFAERARLWWDQDANRVPGSGSSLLLPTALYESMVERAAPLPSRDLKLLRKSAMDLDVYAWLVHRLYRLSRPSRITWAQLDQQFGHSYQMLRMFKYHFNESLKRASELYPDARFKVEEEGIWLHPSRPHVAPLEKIL